MTFNKFNYFMFTCIMLFGAFLTMTTHSWLAAWLGLELNLLGFMPLVLDQSNFKSTEAVMKYFLVSVVSSLMLLFGVFLLPLWSFSLQSMVSNLFIGLALGIKLGCAPFHYWFISLMKTLNTFNGFLLMVIQKLPALFLMSWNVNLYLYFIFIICSCWVGSMGSFYQNTILKMLAFSSIFNLSWVLAGITFGNEFWMTYFFAYSSMLIPILMMITSAGYRTLEDMKNTSLLPGMTLACSAWSMAGLPPLYGFFPKLFLLMYMAQSAPSVLLGILAFTTTINMYLYLRISYDVLHDYKHNLMRPNYRPLYTVPFIFFAYSPLFAMLF